MGPFSRKITVNRAMTIEEVREHAKRNDVPDVVTDWIIEEFDELWGSEYIDHVSEYVNPDAMYRIDEHGRLCLGQGWDGILDYICYDLLDGDEEEGERIFNLFFDE